MNRWAIFYRPDGLRDTIGGRVHCSIGVVQTSLSNDRMINFPSIAPPPRLLSASKTGISKRMPVQLVLLVVWLLCLDVPAAAREAGETFREWKVYGGDPAGTKYSGLDQINRTNVHRLKPVWIYRCDDMKLQPASTIECNPIVVDGVLFLT